jgi:hypothetical protein
LTTIFISLLIKVTRFYALILQIKLIYVAWTGPEAMHADCGGGLTGSYLALGLYPPPFSVLAHLSNSPQLIRKELFLSVASKMRRICHRKSFVDRIFSA